MTTQLSSDNRSSSLTMIPTPGNISGENSSHGDMSQYGDYTYYYYYDYGDFENWMTYGFPEDIAAESINFYIPPILLIGGTIGNILCVIIMCRLTSRMLTSCFYLAFLAFVDTLLLYIRDGNMWIRQICDIDITMKILSNSNASCQVYSFVSNFLLHMCSWLLVTALGEAAMVNAHPMTAHKHISLDRAKNILLLQVLVLICVNAHYFWTYGLEQDFVDPGIHFCTFSTLGSHYSEYFRDSVWPIMDLLASSLLPGIMILICVVYILRARHKQQCSLLSNSFLLHPQATDRLVVLCVGLGIASLVLTLPEFCYNLFEFVIEKLLMQFTGLDFDAKRRLAQAVCVTIRDTFLAFKFIFYCAAWKTFRDEFRALFKKKRRRRGANQSVSSEPLHFSDCDEQNPRQNMLFSHVDPL